MRGLRDGYLLKEDDELASITNDPTILAYMAPASASDVEYVLGLDPDLPEGETVSEPRWVRFANGDLALAWFPQDQGYFQVEIAADRALAAAYEMDGRGRNHDH